MLGTNPAVRHQYERVSMCVQEWAQLIANIAIASTFVVYCLLLRTTIRQLKQNTEATHERSRQQLWSDLLTDFRFINDFIANHSDIPKQPYPTHASNEATFTLLFHHLDLILRYWISKDSKLFEENEKEGFTRWIDETFFRWIASDEKLKKDFESIIKGKDLYPNSFVVWLADRQLRNARPNIS